MSRHLRPDRRRNQASVGGHPLATTSCHALVAVAELQAAPVAVLRLTIGKVFLYDLSNPHDLYRVVSLLGLSISLIGVSLAYQRFMFRAPRKEGRP